MSHTLAALIAIHESHRPPQTVLTPLGAATVAANRLARALEALDQTERLHVLGMLAERMAGTYPNAPTN